MSKHTFATLLFLTASLWVNSQNISNPTADDLIDHLGTEGIYMHYTHNVILTGEYVYFKLYSLGDGNRENTAKSKIAYVELLDQSGARKIIQKVTLENGTGRGDFFIPTSMKSGYYTLLAYTRYMLNWPKEKLFHDQVVIINPYTNDQDIFLDEGPKGAPSLPKTKASPLNASHSNAPFELLLNNDIFSSREPVMLSLKSTPEFYGNYSIAVRNKSNQLVYKESVTPETYDETFKSLSVQEIEKIKYLPELRGELLEGKLQSNSANSSTTAKQRIFFSLPGNNYELAVAETDENGEFMFSLNSKNLSSTAYLHITGEKSVKPEITIAPPPKTGFKNLHTIPFQLKPEMKNALEERSIHNQIENAYFELKPDTVVVSREFTPFYGGASVAYHLDEYTRFNAFNETLVEIVNDAWIDTDKNGRQAIYIRDFANTQTKIGYKPLVIADGLVVEDHEDLISLSAKKIKTIRLFRKQFNMGGKIYQGIFDVVTFDNDFLKVYKEKNHYTSDLLRPQPSKNYFRQEYKNKQSTMTIPDYRHQLLWEPDMVIDKKETHLEFYTSDVKGDFEIILEGFTRDMKPIRMKKNFRVE